MRSRVETMAVKSRPRKMMVDRIESSESEILTLRVKLLFKHDAVP